MLRKFLSSNWAKVAVFVLSLGPLFFLVWRAVQADLTPNPVESATPDGRLGSTLSGVHAVHYAFPEDF